MKRRAGTLIILAIMGGSRPVPAQDAIREARTFMARYAGDLNSGNRSGIIARYLPEGAHFLLNGHLQFRSLAQIDSTYRYGWTPPAHFAWDSLTYEQLAADHILVLGTFRWLSTNATDTTRVVYTGVLRRRDGVWRIRSEIETLIQ